MIIRLCLCLSDLITVGRAYVRCLSSTTSHTLTRVSRVSLREYRLSLLLVKAPAKGRVARLVDFPACCSESAQ